jgi:hypothetical protein
MSAVNRASKSFKIARETLTIAIVRHGVRMLGKNLIGFRVSLLFPRINRGMKRGWRKRAQFPNFTKQGIGRLVRKDALTVHHHCVCT